MYFSGKFIHISLVVNFYDLITQSVVPLLVKENNLDKFLLKTS